ncbi:Glucose-1-phosphatase [Eumeta japonica]|uniref:Glucose-1-phosphatase n=1 Tax=Eumeta variegata TaxID=151549 RepID=A0A4C1VYI4_EUMVA|nr:Glucose-1-phosphatase [Eumeta japonica]
MTSNISWLLLLTSFVGADDGSKLVKVLIFSRHNVRSPLSDVHESYSSKPWPTWPNEFGTLTPRGWLLERIMAKYISLWLQQVHFPVDCSTNVDIYTNNIERTISSGYAFVEGAFPQCGFPVRYDSGSTIDPIFSYSSRNLTPEYEEGVQRYLKNKLLEIDLRESLELMQDIVDVKNSPKCKEEGVCDLMSWGHTISIVPDKEPLLHGPIAISNKLVDTFLMQYYDGFDMKDVAWGLITNETEWKMLLDINKNYHDIIFNDTNIARDLSLSLVKLLKKYLLEDDVKFRCLVGHDANVFTITRLLNFTTYELLGQNEKTPIGGKIVFQKWYDGNTDRHLLKIEYVYASFKQLRDMEELSLENPPMRVTLEMEGCSIDSDGFCMWNDFVQILEAI